MPTISISEAANYFGKSGPVATQMREAAKKGLLSAALRAKQQIITREIPRKTPPPVDKGIYKAGWMTEKLPNGAALYNAVPYAAAIEEGVPAGNVVLSYKFQIMLAEWVKRHGGGRQTGSALAAGAPGGGQRPRINRGGVARDPAAARMQAQDPGAWAAAGAIMHSLKRRGIFKRGSGLQVLGDFAKGDLLAIIRQEVDKALQKVTT
jgi:hypothetical protein